MADFTLVYGASAVPLMRWLAAVMADVRAGRRVARAAAVATVTDFWSSPLYQFGAVIQAHFVVLRDVSTCRE